MMEYSNILYKYIGDNVVEDLRMGKELPQGILNDLLKYPLLDFISYPIKSNDKDLILRLFESNEENSLLAIFLSRGLPDDKDLTKIMLQLFNSSTDVLRKILIFHELVRRDITRETLQELSIFIWNNLDAQLNWAKTFFGSQSEILECCEQRLRNPKFFKKRWVYLINCIASDDKESAKKVIAKYLNDSDNFVKSIAAKCLEAISKSNKSVI